MPILRNMAFGYMAVFYEGHYLLPKLISNLMSVTAVPTIWLMSSFKRKKKSDHYLKRKCLVITDHNLHDCMR